MRTIPLVVEVARSTLYEVDRRLLTATAGRIGMTGRPVADFPDFITVSRSGGLTMSFAKPSYVAQDAEFIEYTSGSLTLRVYRGEA